MRILFFVSLFLVSVAAFAADNNTRHISASFSSGGESVKAVGVADTTVVAGGQTLSAMFSSGRDWIQAYLGFFQTKGVVDFAGGGAYKFTLAGTRALGFHAGPGVMLGTFADDFAFSFFGAAGGHFTVVDRLLFSVDAGPMVTHTANNTNFRLRPLGALLGLSVFYVF